MQRGADRGAQTGGYACTCRGIKARHPPSVLQWVPRSNRLHEWNATRFCEILAHRRLLFIGDSTQQQTASVLMSAVAWGYHTAAGGTANSRPTRRLRGNCASQISFGKSDTLVGRSLGRLNRGRPWHEWVAREEPAMSNLSQEQLHLSVPFLDRKSTHFGILVLIVGALLTLLAMTKFSPDLSHLQTAVLSGSTKGN